MSKWILILVLVFGAWWILGSSTAPNTNRPSLVGRVLRTVAALILLKDAIREPTPELTKEELAARLEITDDDCARASLASAPVNMDEPRQITADGVPVIDFKAGW